MIMMMMTMMMMAMMMMVMMIMRTGSQASSGNCGQQSRCEDCHLGRTATTMADHIIKMMIKENEPVLMLL